MRPLTLLTAVVHLPARTGAHLPFGPPTPGAHAREGPMDAGLDELQIVAVAAPDHGVRLQTHDAPGAVDVESDLCGWMSKGNIE